jgi:hypothetical protein
MRVLEVTIFGVYFILLPPFLKYSNFTYFEYRGIMHLSLHPNPL